MTTLETNQVITFTNRAWFYAAMGTALGNVGSKADAAGEEVALTFLKEVLRRLYPGHGYRTGRLYNSYNVMSSRKGMVINIKGWTNLHYAPYVEYRWGGKVSHFRPAVDSIESKAPEIIRKHLNKIF